MRDTVEVDGRQVPIPTEAELEASAGKVALAWLDLQRAMLGAGGSVVTAAEKFLAVATFRELQTKARFVAGQRNPAEG